MAPRNRPYGVWAGYGAAVWALVFTFLHAVWAGGWYVFLNEERARLMFQVRWKLVYDIVIAVLCALAVIVALALVQPWGRRLPRRPLIGLAWCGTAVLVLRGSAGLTQTAYLMAIGEYSPEPQHLFEAWFCLGAVLFTLSLHRFLSDAWPGADRRR